MRMGLIGLGKMGGNMARRLRNGGVEVVGFASERDVIDGLVKECGMLPAYSLAEMIKQLPTPRVLWLMVPSGAPTEQNIEDLIPLLSKGDVIVDGGNSNYHDTERRGAMLQEKGIRYADVGTSGGVWGLANGYCLMAGGDDATIKIIEPALKVLAPEPNRGWAHVGPLGSGHYTKMIHNGIEYGMMQAFAEGFALMKSKKEFHLDMAQIAELWRHSSVVRSWLLDLTAEGLKDDQELESIAPFVPDSGEGRWTVVESVDQGVPTPVMTLALQMRFSSQDGRGYGNRLLSMMRNAFGGHSVKKNS